ncbi:MAG: hypothetical protein J6E43_05910 [Prevotella sp.]|nr:hypothetical protein [Prevotella sp.]
MKIIKYIVLALMVTMTVELQAKPVKPAHVYMFGFSASFQDSIVYVTDIQDVQGAWIESKTKFLLGRDNYSYQLKEHFTNNLQDPDRVCMVFYATSKSKAEKIMKKLMKKYVPNHKKSKKKWKTYDVRYITTAYFNFSPIDMSPDAQ